MTGPGDSSLTAKAIASKSGQRSKSATADNKRSMILFTNKPMLRMGRAREMLLPRPTAVSSRSLWSISDERESKILARNGGEDTRVSEFVNATLRRRTTRSGNELHWPKACVRTSTGSPGIKSTTPSSWFARKSALPAHFCAQGSA